MKHERTAEAILEALRYSEPFKTLVDKGQQRKARQSIARVLKALCDEICSLPEGESLSLQGFGRFEWRRQEERSHYNLVTKLVEKIPAKWVIAFEPARGVRRVIEDGGADHGGSAGEPGDGVPAGVRLREVPVVDERLEESEEG